MIIGAKNGAVLIDFHYFLRFPEFPVSRFITKEPTLRCRPCLVRGMPVARAIFCFAAVMPTARFHEKDSPGIFIMVVKEMYGNLYKPFYWMLVL